MHLREVHMENFKSFGRKLTVPFEPGYTAITGPNGSGKSNIGDAVLFVLGPNSPRAIRAGRLSDLIFNGGEGGKPADHCQVSLVFDNADRTMPVDADTVTLTRKVRLAPSKEDPDGYHSYFYVNGRASQKKEFVDLLQHARIAADGYNITQQGDVLRICTMSNMDRRKILDDIAGVTTFDKDIAAADQRKAEVAANLERIGIVLDEIGRSLDQLGRDKGAAVRFKELQDSIKRLKGLSAWRRKSDLTAQIAQVQQQIDSYGKDRERMGQQLAELQQKYKEVQQRFAETEQKIRAEGGEEVAQLQERMKEARDQMVRMEEKVNFAKGELQAAKEDASPLAEELRKIERELERTAKAQADMAAEAEKAGKDLAGKKRELDQLRDMIGKSDAGAMQVNKELAQLKHEHEAKLTEVHEAKLELDRNAAAAKALETAIATTETDLAASDKDHQETLWQLKELQKTGAGSGRQRKDLEKAVFDLRKAQAELARDNEELENRIRRLQRELAELRAAQEAAAQVQGGYGRAVEEVLAAREKRLVKGIVGTITELAKVKDQHRTALQTAAAGRLNAVIVEDDATAAACIEMLKKSGAGRATFLPLNKMVPGRPRGQALMAVKKEGCLGFALDLIEFNERYQNAFFHVFGDTLVVDTMANGRKMMGGVRIVTLDGELFEASGAMSGGNAKGKKGEEPTFGNADRGRMDELLQQVAAAEQAQNAGLDRLAKLRAQQDELQAQLDALGRQDVSGEDRVKELESKAGALVERRATIEEALQAHRKGLADLQKAAAKLERTVSDDTARLEELERLRHEKGQLLLKGTRKDLKEKVEALEAAIRELTEAALKAENRRDVAAKQLELVQARKAEVAAAAGDKGLAAERFAEDIKRYAEAYTKAKAEVEALLKMERKATGALKGLQDAKDKAYQELVDLKAKMDKVADRMETQYGLIASAKAKLPGLEEALGEAQVELAENPVEVTADFEVPAMEDLKRDLRNQEAALDRLGPVNMRALEEFEAQEARQGELLAETDRLKAQREELVNLVAAITTKKKAALMEVFAAINENFSAVYAQLSLGGHAHMELENEEDPFVGGLILKAQPVGKKVTRLEALSGGEKSLTSMAFIFALQRHEPSPFYYFDEVDQNLDAVNSELLSKMIRSQAQYAQFIIVSLRKITLKEASHIYGVTQQTPGQSEIIANFDIDTLRDEESEKPGPGGPAEGSDGGDAQPPAAPAPAAPKRPAKEKKEKAKETTIQGLLERAITVEVKP